MLLFNILVILIAPLHAQLTVTNPTTGIFFFPTSNTRQCRRRTRQIIFPSKTIGEKIYGWNRGFSIVYGSAEEFPPSKSKNDYLSHASLGWPSNSPACKSDPNSKDCQYLTIDGKRVPHTYAMESIYSVGSAVLTLSTVALRYKRQRFATRAQDMIQMFFLNDTTKMNPNLDNAQFLRGKNPTIFGKGAVDGRLLAKVANAYKLLKKGGMWAGSTTKLKDWFKDLAKRLKTSSTALDEKDDLNHHVIWYQSTQVVAYYASEDTDNLGSLLRNSKAGQFVPLHPGCRSQESHSH
ncbi:alginate lyase-domain-containing protein [Cladochytrium replicatum]|nr:alginate lyase-domain-containing protein [Cladochytrium replicatum]